MKIDFHVHTHFSYDSLMKPAKILQIAKKRGLDGIVICDHNTIQGGIETQKLNKDKNFHVIVGAEIATDAGDITGIFLTREIESRDFNTVIEEIRAQNGKVILNHPYKGHDLTKVDMSKIDFVEGYNSRLSMEDNQKAHELAKAYTIPMTAGSDAHGYAEIGNSKTTVNDIVTLIPLEHEYQRTKQLYVTFSQYIKAIKRRNSKIFVSATIMLIKYTSKQCARAIKKAFKS